MHALISDTCNMCNWKNENLHVHLLYNGLGQGKAANEIVCKTVCKNSIPSFLVMASACVLGPCQWIPGYIFHPCLILKWGLGTRLPGNLLINQVAHRSSAHMIV